jgi:hypothetical protein
VKCRRTVGKLSQKEKDRLGKDGLFLSALAQPTLCFQRLLIFALSLYHGFINLSRGNCRGIAENLFGLYLETLAIYLEKSAVGIEKTSPESKVCSVYFVSVVCGAYSPYSLAFPFGT